LTDPIPSELHNDTLSMVIHAASKVGKSTLCSTAPLPICVWDVEGSWRFIRRAGFCEAGVHMTERCPCPPLRIRRWNPNTEYPPRYDGTWDVASVKVGDWRTMTNAYMYLAHPDLHDFKSLIVDSVTESQRKLKGNLRGLEQMRQQDWGDLLVQMDKLIRDCRDLVLIDRSPLKFVAFVGETRMENGKWRPYMQGAVSVALPYWVDIVGYLYPTWEPDAQGQATRQVNHLWIGPSQQFETGERVQGVLGVDIRDPHLGRMMETLFQIETAKTGDNT